MNFRHVFFVLGFLIIPMQAFGNEVEPYIVSASRFVLPANQVGSDVTVISAEEIQTLQASTVADVLNTVPGVDVVYQGNGLASVFARGSRSSSMLVLVDGVPVNDPSYPSFDFNRLSLVNVERVEVVLGSQSAIYGANALAGVVNIISKQGEGNAQGSVYGEIGIPFQSKIDVNARAGSETLAWSLGAQARYNKLFSEAAKRFNAREKDERADAAFSGSLTFTPTDIFNVRVDGRYDTQGYDYDSFAMDSLARFYSQRYLMRVAPSLILFDGKWTQKLDLSFVDSQSHTERDTFGDNKYHGNALRADWQHKLDFGWQSIVFGALAQYETNYADKENNSWLKNSDQTNYAVYAEYTINPLDNLYFTGAWRMDNSDIFHTEHSYSLSAAYTLDSTGTFLHGSIGKAYKTPSLQELYGPWGNADLKAEKAYSWDLGISQPLFNDKLEIYATYYQVRYNNLISYSYALGKSFNYDRVDASGLEMGFKVYPTEGLSIKLASTFAKTHVESTDEAQLRQPNASFRLDADYVLPLDTQVQYTVGLSYTFVGARTDINDSFSNERMSSYNLVDLRFKAAVNEDLSLYLKVGNLFNEKYESVWGYSSLGINGLLGIEWKF